MVGQSSATFEDTIVRWLGKMPEPVAADGSSVDRIVTEFALLKKTIKGCMLNSDAILPVSKAFDDFEEANRFAYHDSASKDEQFSSAGAFTKVIDQTWLLTEIQRNTDLLDVDLLVITKRKTNIDELFEAKYQLSPTLKMLPELQIKQVCRGFLEARAIEVGQPLRDIRARGILGTSDGKLVWTKRFL